MTIKVNAALRGRLAGSALGLLIAFAAVPAAMAQWLPPWRAVASSADIAGRLNAQGYLLIAPLQRRPGVYLADVRAGPTGYQRLVIDDRSGEILERFISPPRNFSPGFAARYDEFAQLPPPGVVQSLPGPGSSAAPNGGPAARFAYRGPTNVRIPDAVSPYGSQPAPVSTKPKPKSAATAPKIPPVIAPPLPPPSPREAAKPDESVSTAPKPEPKIESAQSETGNASTASAPAAAEAKPAPAEIEPQPEAAQAQQPEASVKSATPGTSAEASDKSKTSIVPPALFE
jgi:hypothetical protein